MTSIANQASKSLRSSDSRDASHFTRRSAALFIVIAFAFAAARLWHLTSYGLFGDEVFTLWTAAQDWRSLFASVIGDVAHPPLFYALLKVWINLAGQSVLWLKLLPALLSIGSILPFALLCNEMRLKPAAMSLALLLMAVNGFLINHAQELRMYSLLLLLTVCSIWLFIKLARTEAVAAKTQTALWVVNLLLVFSHYYGWIVVALELVCLLIWNRRRARVFSIGVALLVVCFAPWVYCVAKAARENPSRLAFTWNRPPAASEIIGYYANLSGPLAYRWKLFGPALVLIVFLAPMIAWAWQIINRQREREEDNSGFLWLILFAFGPVAFAFLASHTLPHSVWAYRYLIVAAPAYFLLVTTAVFKLRNRRVRTAFIVLILGWSCLSGFTEIIDRDKIAWQPLVERMIQAEPGQANFAVYVTDANVGNTIQFYLDEAGDSRFKISNIADWESLDDDRFWVGLIRYKHEVGPLLQDALKDRGYDVTRTIEAEASGHQAVLFRVLKR